MTKRSSSGENRNNSDATMELMQTDLPEPVAPAINMCGISARSATIGLP